MRLYARFAGADHDWWGEVVRTEGEIDPQSRMVHVIARVSHPIDEDGTPLPVGLFVQASIEAQLVENVFVLPRAALYDGTRVVVVDDQDRLRRGRCGESNRQSGPSRDWSANGAN